MVILANHYYFLRFKLFTRVNCNCCLLLVKYIRASLRLSQQSNSKVHEKTPTMCRSTQAKSLFLKYQYKNCISLLKLFYKCQMFSNSWKGLWCILLNHAKVLKYNALQQLIWQCECIHCLLPMGDPWNGLKIVRIET